MIIAIDFDGTCVTHDFPKIGKDIGAVPVLKKLIINGHKLILYTMRGSAGEGNGSQEYPDVGPANFLKDAVDWFNDNDIPLYGVNRNPNQEWTNSPKCYAELYIDDAALGCPLKFNPYLSVREFADWDAIEQLLILKKII